MFYDASSSGSTFEISSINHGLNPNLKRGEMDIKLELNITQKLAKDRKKGISKLKEKGTVNI